MTRATQVRPAPIDWRAAPRHQVEQIFQAACRRRYSPDLDYPPWPDQTALATVSAERQLAGSFEGDAWVWRRDPGPKLVHTRGAVAMFRLEATDHARALCGTFGDDQWCLGRYSRAANPADDFPPVPGVALKLPRVRRPALDVLMVGEVWEAGCFEDTWANTIATAMVDPRTASGPLPQLVLDVLKGFDTVVDALDLGPDVSAVRLPPPLARVPGLNAPVQRLIWQHTDVAKEALRDWGPTPFSNAQYAPTHLEQDDTVAAVASEPWAHLVADDGTSTVVLAAVTLESRFHVGPVGDYWLHFTHPRRTR